uniref:U6 small nuclear RNA (adenine-(43)-N(6))-methyltransferase n=1 Tax=Caligus rogercresseyi TaxID=217165 RepID=C1BQJ5_CALRO|nr:methyltransferase METT10D [Caligus rogercresseyi]
MSLNDLMHQRNPYKVRPDFKALAEKYPEFRSHLKTDLRGNVNLDFKSGVGVLTKILLLQDFGLSMSLPTGALVPTLPLRFNYLLWIQDILELNQRRTDIRGLDIGVGCSCIYPLLAARHFNWSMLGFENHPESLKHAQANITQNQLSDKISVLSSSSFFRALGDTVLDFTMCNPPFFDSNCYEAPQEERPGLEHEMMTEGGEEEFVKNMIKESLQVKAQARIFTCMLGKKSSLIEIKKFLYSLTDGVSWSFTEFCQGKTMRWGIVWSFSPGMVLPTESALTVKKKAIKKSAPLSFTLSTSSTCIEIFRSMNEVLSNELECHVEPCGKSSATKVSAEVKASQAKWKNQRRLRREKLRQEDNPSDPKRRRMEPESKGIEQNDDSIQQLSFEMNIHKHKDKMIVEFIFIEGKAGKDGLHQLIQYLRNKLSLDLKSSSSS